MKKLNFPLAVIFLSLNSSLNFAEAEIKNFAEAKAKNFSVAKIKKPLFEAKNAHQATMTFETSVIFTMRGNSKPSRQKMLKKIENQIAHLFGPMSEAAILAVPKGDHIITLSSKEPQRNGNTWTVEYSYKGTLLVSDTSEKFYKVVLPINPDSIYEAGHDPNNEENPYPCTDHHYNSEGDFWYFWNPKNEGCPLKEGKDYVIIKASLEKKKNSSDISPTQKTYPEYARLIRIDAQGNEAITISVLMGMDEPKTSDRNPMISEDINAKNYRDFLSELTKSESLKGLGFIAGTPWENDKIRTIVKKSQSELADKDLGFVQELKKTYMHNNKKLTLTIRMFFGASGINDNSTASHYFFKDALENQSVMIYDGHSGLGGHLDLASIEETEGFTIHPNQNEYQVYFFNSCSSYTYYNSMYFDKKITSQDPLGTKNLDILNNGLATLFRVMQETNLSVIKAIDGWLYGKPFSYQELAEKIDSNNLFAVNGDEDNSTEPAYLEQ